MPAAAEPRLPVLVEGASHLSVAVREELAARGIPIVEPDAADRAARLSAAILCDDDDLANLAAALRLRERWPDARLVLRAYNTRLRSQLPQLLGDCRVLSASRIAAPALCDLAVGAGGPDRGPRRRTWLTRLRDRARGGHATAIGRQLWRRPLFRWSLLLLLVLVVIQSWLVAEARGHEPIEALHDGIAGIMTLGFSDTGLIGASLAKEAAWLQVAAVATSLIDVVLFTVLLGLVADALVSERFARVFGGSARRLSGHVVIAGLGTVGYRILRELYGRGYRCSVIEADEDSPFLAGARALGASVTIADVRQEEEFAALGLERAVAFIAVTDDDAANLEAALTASSIAPSLPIITRCFDPELATRLETLGSISASRSVARLAAPSFVDAAVRV